MQACYKHGIPASFCAWYLKVMEAQTHHILTCNGKSTEGYKSTFEKPIHGIGQGSTAAPILWLLISSTLFTAMKTRATGMKWSSPTGEINTERVADAYVDDTTLWFNNIKDTDKLIEIMERDLTHYQELLEWTGGALTLTKCFFSIMEWEFDEDRTPQLKKKTHKLQIP